jgi:hypothetical protein
MANANLIIAVSRGLRPAQISGAVANARSTVNQLLATKQIADRNTLIVLSAANSIQSPSNINLFV